MLAHARCTPHHGASRYILRPRRLQGVLLRLTRPNAAPFGEGNVLAQIARELLRRHADTQACFAARDLQLDDTTHRSFVEPRKTRELRMGLVANFHDLQRRISWAKGLLGYEDTTSASCAPLAVNGGTNR
jgi:hypothetical protein